MIVSVCALAFGAGFGFYAFPKLLRRMIKGVSYFNFNIFCTRLRKTKKSQTLLISVVLFFS